MQNSNFFIDRTYLTPRQKRLLFYVLIQAHYDYVCTPCFAFLSKYHNLQIAQNKCIL